MQKANYILYYNNLSFNGLGAVLVYDITYKESFAKVYIIKIDLYVLTYIFDRLQNG